MLLDRVRSLWPPEITAISSGSYNWTRVATSLSLSVPTRPDYFPGGRRRGGDPFPQIASPPPLPEALLLPGFHAPSFQLPEPSFFLLRLLFSATAVRSRPVSASGTVMLLVSCGSKVVPEVACFRLLFGPDSNL
jgi:hypothetical protein